MSELKSIPKAKVLEQIATPSIKNSPLGVGQEVVTGDIVAGMSYKRGNKEITPDNILCEVEGRFISVPVAELMKMKNADGKVAVDFNGENLEIPARFKIVSKTDRKGADNKVIFPAASYKGYGAYINKADRTMEDYTELLKTDRLEGAVAVQDYVISL